MQKKIFEWVSKKYLEGLNDRDLEKVLQLIQNTPKNLQDVFTSRIQTLFLEWEKDAENIVEYILPTLQEIYETMLKEVVAKKKEVVAKKKEELATNEILERIIALKADLQKSSITPETKIPGYQSELKTTQESLKKQGKDPKYAEWVLLAKYQAVLLDGIKPEDPKYASLAKSFATIQGDLRTLEISYAPVEVMKSARIAGLSNTQIDASTYEKLRAGMPEFKTGEVFVTGNTMISRADTTGARTVMDIKSGERWKERSGLQIRSDVPTESPESKKTRETIVTKEASVANLQKGIQGDVGYLTRVTSDPEIRKSLSLPPSLVIDASSPEKLTQSLTALRGSILKSTPSDPPTGEEKNLLSKIESLIESQNTPGGKLEQLQLEKAALKTLQSQSAILPVQDQIRLRDQAIDANLSILTRFGLHHLGQEKFNVLEKSLQKKLSGNGTAVFDLQKPLLGTDPDQQEILAQMIAHLANANPPTLPTLLDEADATEGLINTNPSTLSTSLYTREKGISSTAGDTLKGKQFSTQDIERAAERL